MDKQLSDHGLTFFSKTMENVRSLPRMCFFPKVFELGQCKTPPYVATTKEVHLVLHQQYENLGSSRRKLNSLNFI